VIWDCSTTPKYGWPIGRQIGKETDKLPSYSFFSPIAQVNSVDNITSKQIMIAKKMLYALIAVVICGLVYMGWKLTARNAYESAEYTILESDGNIELREYPELMLATTNMGTRIQGDDGSFGRLFQYISGSNEAKQKIAMTTPVFMEPESDQTTSGQMSFVIPKEVAQSKIPAPANEQVQVSIRPAGKFAVIRFAGRIDTEICLKQRSKLEAWIEDKGHAVDGEGEAEVAGYDPPWTPGPLRRNEILIRIESE